MKIFKYNDEKHYRDAQIKANIEKLDRVWIHSTDIDYMVPHIRFNPELILCHGSRNGAEIKFWKNQYPKAKVFGTEISSTAKQFPNTIRHDFQKPHHKFNANCDIIYSNSFDHTYDPIKTLNVWKNQLKPNGLMFIDLGWDNINNASRESDPLELESEEEWINLLKEVGLNGERILKRISTIDESFAGAIYMCTHLK